MNQRKTLTNSMYEAVERPKSTLKRNILALSNRWNRTFTISLLLLSLWLLTRPYLGIVGDARFYALQGLFQLDTSAFREDLFLAGSSKDPFSIYELGYAPILDAFGLQNANFVLYVSGSLFWLGGLFFLARSIFRSELILIWSLALAIVLPSNLNFFSVGEAIVTPRIFSEALTLYGFGCMLRGRMFFALILMGFAFEIHPLMAIAGFLFLLIYESKRRTIIFSLGLITIFIGTFCVFIFSEPMFPWFQIFDRVWLQELRVREYSDFIGNWPLATWLPICNTVMLAGACIPALDYRHRELLVITACVALFGFVVAFIGGDLLHIVLIFDLQLWRCAWLFLVITHLLIAQAVVDPICLLPWQKTLKMLVCLSLTFTVLSYFNDIFLLLAIPTVLLILIFRILDFSKSLKILVLKRCLFIIFIVFIACLFVLAVQFWLNSIKYLKTDRDFALLGIGLVSACLGKIYLSVNVQRDRSIGRYYNILGLPFSLLVLVGTVSIWDQRTSWTKYIDDASIAPVSLSNLLPHDEAIYWEGDVTVPWFLLRQASYFSCDQGAAVLFSRPNAVLYSSRYQDFSKLHSIDFGVGPYCPKVQNSSAMTATDIPSNQANPSQDNNVISALCTQESRLGAIVLLHPIDNEPVQIWHAPVPFSYILTTDKPTKIHYVNIFYIYKCRT